MTWQRAILTSSVALSLVARVAHAADPTAGDCVHANDRAIALKSNGQLTDARAALAVCSSAACPLEIRRECARQIEEINATMPTIVFHVKDGNGNDLTDCHVTMDGRPLLEGLSGIAVAVDPGPHSFAFEAPGFHSLLKRFLLNQGEKNRREDIVMSAAAPRRDPVAIGDGAPAPRRAPTPSISLAAALLGGAGLASLGAGATILAFAAATENRAVQEDRLAPGFGHSDHVAAQRDWIAGSIVAGCGLVLAGAGLVLAIRSPASRPAGASRPPAAVAVRVLPEVAPYGLDLVMKGSFW
jgi:hypothetical protein